MQRTLLTLFINCLLITCLFAQSGSIAGHVVDSGNSEDLIGATVSLENNKSVGTTTDIDGRFSLESLQPGKYNLLITYVSYNTKLIQDVEVKAGQVTNMQVALESNANELEEVVVTSTFSKENVNSLLIMQKNFASVSDGISADIIRKTPDKNTGDALKRVSGVTIQNGRFVIVRGLPDRYNTAMINGSPLPSTEPDRKVFSFDLIPSFLVDNIIIVKTAQPDLPGDFAGGIVTINTRDVPEQNFLSFSAGIGMNTLANFNTWYSYQGGRTDWLGKDDGTRALPSAFPGTETITSLANSANTEILDYSLMLPNDWAFESRRSAPLGFNGQLVGGFKKRTGKTSSFSLVGGATYNSSNKLSNFSRYDFASDGTPQYEYFDSQSKNNVSWGSLVNLAYSLNDNNRITFKNSYTVNTDDIMTVRTGDEFSNVRDIKAYAYNYIENSLLNSQLEGSHFLRGSKIKIDWNGAYSKTTRKQPDYRRLYYFKNYEDSAYTTYIPFGSASPNYGGKFYSNLFESNYSAGVNASIPFVLFKNTSTFKMGTFHQWKSRDFDARVLGYVVYDISKFYSEPGNAEIFFQGPGDIFSHENISETGFRIDEITNPSDAYTASSQLHAYYAMLDNQLPANFRLIWGARIEYFDQTLTSFEYGGAPVDYHTSSADFNNLPFDFLPSVNLVHSLTQKINLRAAFSKTVARPEFREVAPFSFYNFDDMESRIGNDSLGRTSINNYDLKFENFFGNGQVISISAFYKQFNDPIEQKVYPGSGAGSRTVTWVNADEATVYGIELELRKNLDFISKVIQWKQFENITFSTNLALIKSVVDQTNDPNAWKPERPLQGQSPYIINFGFTYTDPVSELGLGLFFNQIGRRIDAIGDKNYPDIYENGRPLLDAQISKRIFKGGSLKLNMNDILAKGITLYQDQNDNGKLDDNGDDTIITQQRLGSNFSLSFSYNF
ncbi:MAG TPA: TonB-dependent receptor [Chitinophagales bacterium]|nr:TonB-dependent receptor [Chitinophagales bacterium]